MISFSSLSTAAGVTNIVACTTPCHLRRIQGYFKGSTADRWLQIHDASALPADTSVPVKSYALPQTAPFSWEFDPSEFNLASGLVIAVSTTEATLTISTDKMDCFGEVEPHIFIPQDYSVAGDLSTAIDLLQVWADASGPKRLYRLFAINNDGADHYIMLFAKDNGATANGQSPIRQWTVTAGNVLELDFGDDGISPFSVDATTQAQHVGCTIQGSSTTGTLTKTAGTFFCIQAYYK